MLTLADINREIDNIVEHGTNRADVSTLADLYICRELMQEKVKSETSGSEFAACINGKCFSEIMPCLEELMDTLKVISGKMAPFVRAMMGSGEYDEFEPGMVLDMYQLLPEDYDRYIRGANCEIFYFLTSDVTPEERFAIQKKYDTEKDYTFYKPDEELREGAVYIVEQSILMREQCEKYGLPYYETARNREQVFERFLRDLESLKNGG